MAPLLASLGEVPPVPPAPHSSLIANLSVFFIVSGIAVVLSALSPVRRAARDLMQRTNERVYSRPQPTPQPSAPTEPASQVSTPATRREIETFDLDMFA